MQRIRRAILLLALVIALISFVLLLDMTAPNPTGRRHSSASPLVTGEADAGAIGLSGEEVVATDLGLPRNELADQRQCICRDADVSLPTSECRVCFVYNPDVSAYRRPDFVASGFIVEVKNVKRLMYSGRELDQLKDYASTARLLGVPLWLYVRVNSLVDPEFIALAQSTGGDVIYYLTVPGYSDPVYAWSGIALLLAVVTIALILLWEWRRFRRAGRRSLNGTGPNGGPKHKSPKNPADRTGRKLDAAESFHTTVRDKTRRVIDEEDSRDEL